MSAKLTQSTCSRPISLRSILTSSSLLPLGLPSSPIPSCYRMKNLYTFPFFATRTTLARVKEDEMDTTCGTRAVHLILLNFITSIKSGDQYKSRISSLHEFLQSPVTSPSPSLNTLGLCSSQYARHRVQYTHRTTCTAAVLCTLVPCVYKTTYTAAILCTLVPCAYKTTYTVAVLCTLVICAYKTTWTATVLCTLPLQPYRTNRKTDRSFWTKR